MSKIKAISSKVLSVIESCEFALFTLTDVRNTYHAHIRNQVKRAYVKRKNIARRLQVIS